MGTCFQNSFVGDSSRHTQESSPSVCWIQVPYLVIGENHRPSKTPSMAVRMLRREVLVVRALDEKESELLHELRADSRHCDGRFGFALFFCGVNPSRSIRFLVLCDGDDAGELRFFPLLDTHTHMYVHT